MSPRQVIAALTRRAPATDGPDDIEQWVDGLRDNTTPAALVDLATTAPIDTAAVLAELSDDLTRTDDTRKEQA